MEKISNFGMGLQLLPRDDRDLSLGTVYGVVKKEDLPAIDFDLSPDSRIENQGRLDFCATFAGTSVTEDQEGEEMDPLWQFAQAKKIRGEWKSWGCDLRSAGMSFVKAGSLPAKHAPYAMGEQTRDVLANWESYHKALDELAAPHKKASLWFVDGPHDTFDNIRSALWKAYNAKSVVDRSSLIGGTLWRYSWNLASGGVIPKKGWESDEGEGHAIKIRGQKKIKGEWHLIIQNSWGEDVGEKGLFYFPRAVVNACFGPYGQIAFKDMEYEEARYYNDNGINIGDNWLVALAKALYNAIAQLLHPRTP